nr:hypothetical protein [Tanacetum cinerariifolium]
LISSTQRVGIGSALLVDGFGVHQQHVGIAQHYPVVFGVVGGGGRVDVLLGEVGRGGVAVAGGGPHVGGAAGREGGHEVGIHGVELLAGAHTAIYRCILGGDVGVSGLQGVGIGVDYGLELQGGVAVLLFGQEHLAQKALRGAFGSAAQVGSGLGGGQVGDGE